MTREKLDAHYKEIAAAEKKRHVAALLEKLDAPDYQRDQDAATEQRRERSSGHWLFSNHQYKEWSDESCIKNPILYMHGVPGAGRYSRLDCMGFRTRLLRTAIGKTTLAYVTTWSGASYRHTSSAKAYGIA